MGDAPEPPRWRTPEAKSVELRDRRQPPNGCEVAMVPIPKGSRRGLAPDSRADYAGDVMALLLSGGGQPRYEGAGPALRRRGVADREDPRTPGHRQIVTDDNPACSIAGLIEPPGRRRSSYSRRPKCCSGSDALAIYLDPFAIDSSDLRTCPNFDAKVAQGSFRALRELR